MFKLMDKKRIAILRKLFLLNWPYGFSVPENCFIVANRHTDFMTLVKKSCYAIFKVSADICDRTTHRLVLIPVKPFAHAVRVLVLG